MQNDEGNLSDNLVELYKNIKQFCELCTQLKCYKNVTNCYKIVTFGSKYIHTNVAFYDALRYFGSKK